jgi:hypothetical protein
MARADLKVGLYEDDDGIVAERGSTPGIDNPRRRATLSRL